MELKETLRIVKRKVFKQLNSPQVFKARIWISATVATLQVSGECFLLIYSKLRKNLETEKNKEALSSQDRNKKDK